MTDIFDRASEVEEIQRLDALDMQTRRAGMQYKTIDDSALLCAICEMAIPDPRRVAVPGVQTCIACQCEIEQTLHLNCRSRP